MTRWKFPNDQIVMIDTPFTYNDIQYPANWIRLSSPADRAALGMVELPEPPRADERFYYVNTDGTIVQKPLSKCQQVIKSQLASIRQNKETLGVVYENNVYQTDTDSRINYIGALQQAQADPNYTVRWKARTDGDPSTSVFVTLDAADLATIINGGVSYITACFDNEDSIVQQIEATTTLAELLAIDLESGWPSRNL